MFANAFADAKLARIAASTKPIFIGPWRSEIGFESLYWLPWLTKWRERYQIEKSRLIAVSRGGAGAWYDAAQHVELYDYAPVSSVRRAMLLSAAQTGSVKQHAITAQEQTILQGMAQDLGLTKYHTVHPSLMYQQLTPWWDGHLGLSDLLNAVSFAPIPTPHPPLELPLPEKFVAVSFYARHTWPMDEERKDWVAALVEGLARIVPVVLLESGLHADEHVPFPFKGDNIQSTATFCTPQNNLGVQSAVLAKAQAFVGTYGGTMQLAVRLGKPALGFYTHFAGTAYAHKLLTEWLGVQQRTPVCIGRPDDAKFVQEALQVAYVPQAVNRGSSVAQK